MVEPTVAAKSSQNLPQSEYEAEIGLSLAFGAGSGLTVNYVVLPFLLGFAPLSDMFMLLLSVVIAIGYFLLLCKTRSDGEVE